MDGHMDICVCVMSDVYITQSTQKCSELLRHVWLVHKCICIYCFVSGAALPDDALGVGTAAATAFAVRILMVPMVLLIPHCNAAQCVCGLCSLVVRSCVFGSRWRWFSCWCLNALLCVLVCCLHMAVALRLPIVLTLQRVHASFMRAQFPPSLLRTEILPRPPCWCCWSAAAMFASDEHEQAYLTDNLIRDALNGFQKCRHKRWAAAVAHTKHVKEYISFNCKCWQSPRASKRVKGICAGLLHCGM